MGLIEKISILLSMGIHLYDVLHFMGINALNIYGAGRLGQNVISDIYEHIKIEGIFDAKINEVSTIEIWHKDKGSVFLDIYPMERLCENKKENTPIMITPLGLFGEISESLNRNGISKNRMFSLEIIVDYGFYYMLNLKNRGFVSFPKKQYLITGAQFGNKGAQSMLFTTVSQIRSRVQEVLIWYLPNYWEDEYRRVWQEYQMIFLRSGVNGNDYLQEVFTHIDGVFDVGGAAMAVEGEDEKRTESIIKLSIRNNVPIYLMPQSFSPEAFILRSDDDVKKFLGKVTRIFARESEGYIYLTEKLGLSNVFLSEDIVLQNKEPNFEHIYYKPQFKIETELASEDYVALVPNTQNYRHNSKEQVIGFYTNIINELLHCGRQVYIIPHSEDWELCEKIFETVKLKDRVTLYKGAMDSWKFQGLIGNFKYAVASRYHSIVHAYKAGVPCVIISWLEKYHELANKFEQGEYLLDIRNDISEADVKIAIQKMESNYEIEKKKIMKKLTLLQNQNCFDVIL